jgi:DNA-binding Xre family transcriptional regulator
MPRKKHNRIIRRSTPAEKRRHNQIREKTDEEFASRRKPVSDTRVILARLRSLRELKGLSLAEVAKRAGMARSNLCRLERNGENARLDTLQRYARALDCAVVVEIRDSRTKTKR